MDMPNLYVLLGVALVVAGFALRFNPLLVVTVAGLVTGLIGGLDIGTILADFGDGFVQNRYLLLFLMPLPVIGLLEHFGLQEQARRLIQKFASMTPGRVLTAYLLLRQITSALGLISLCGHPQTVRPLVAPMVEGAAERELGGPLDGKLRQKLLAFCASADNVGLFFGEDIFIAVGSILLMVGYFGQNGFKDLEPLDFAVWAIPTAVLASLIHGSRLLLLDRLVGKGRRS